MEFKMHTFIKKSEMKRYTLVRNGVYDFMAGDGKPVEFDAELFLYKKSRNIIVANTSDGLHGEGNLNGYCLKTYDIKQGDIVITREKKYRITELYPKEHGDFIEFTLEEVRHD